MNQKKELGKGIRALLGDINEQINDDTINIHSENPATLSSKNYISIEQIEVNPFQPRKNFEEEALEELAQSIRIHGLIQPITVRKIKGNEKYQIISGERRWRASQLADLKEVPVFIRIANDQESLEMALIENIQRENLNAIEVGVNYQRLLDECELSHEELATRMGKKRATISNYIRLLKLPPDIQVAVKEGKISMGHARALAGVEEIDRQLHIYKEIISKNLSVRQAESLVAKKPNNKQPKSTEEKNSTPPVIRKWQDKISSSMGTKVSINHNSNGSGSIVLPYIDEADLERLIDMLG